MKVASLVSPTGAPGGAERALLALARRLPEYGWASRIILLQHGPFETWLAEAGCDFEVLPMTRTRHLHRTAMVVESLRRKLRGVSAVVANQSKGQAIVGAAATLSRTPCIWWQHGIPGWSPIEAVAGWWPTAAIVCSPGPAADTQRKKTPRRRIEVINPGIDIERVRSQVDEGSGVRKQMGWSGPVVGMVARLQPHKGQQLFLQAASIVVRHRPDVHFAIVGGATLGWEGDYEQQLRRQAAELGLSERVHFTGHQDDPHPWADAFDVAVTASVGESFGLVTVEAMALGKPVVGVDSAGTAEIIEDGVSGLLVPPADPKAMAAAVLDLLEDPALRARIAAGAAARAEQFSDVKMARRFAALLDEVGRPR
jgi:glycosyltransferase involved in cell wall biosynthesis